MNSLRIRFAIGFSLLFTTFLAIAFLIVYFSYADYRKDEFHKRLKDRALTTFKLLVEVEQIDHELLQVINKNTLNSLYDEKVMVFQNDTLIYSSLDDKQINYSAELLQTAKEEKEIFTSIGEDELVAVYIEQGGKAYTILAEALDKNGRNKVKFLRIVMFIVYASGLLIGWAATFFFVKRVIKPLDTLKNNIQQINPSNLDMRLQQSKQGEEVDSLAANFNQMLERLQQSFSIQKDFVHYASHELRTPLTAMIGITENALSKKIDNDQFNRILKQLYYHQQNLAGITNSLLLLSDDKLMFEKTYPSVRLDELVFRSVEIIQNLYPEAHINVNFVGTPLSEESLMVRANEPLLLLAFNNLLKNALQYSFRNEAIITINVSGSKKQIEFKNIGSPISEEESKMIFTPFYRAANSKLIKGHGLGLSLVRQIVKLHNALITYSREQEYNVFHFIFWDNEPIGNQPK